MAFTDTERAKIRLYLGYPDLFRYKHTRLESVIADGALSADAEALVIANLTAIDAVLADLGAKFESGSLKRVDEIEFYQTTSSSQGQAALKKARMHASQISITLGVPFYADPFSSDGYPGDKLSLLGGLGNPGYSGRGGPIPLG